MILLESGDRYLMESGADDPGPDALPRRFYRPRSAVSVLSYLPQSPVQRTVRPSANVKGTFVPGNRG